MPGWLCRGIWLPLGRQKMPKEKVGSSWMCMYVIGAGRPLHACMRTESKPPPGRYNAFLRMHASLEALPTSRRLEGISRHCANILQVDGRLLPAEGMLYKLG